MKKILLALVLSLTTCFMSVSASAQNVTNYPTSVYSLNDARSFEYNGWLVIIQFANGTQSAFNNNALTVFNAMRAAHGGTTTTSKFTQVTGTNLYVNTSMAASFHCSNSKTQINWNNQGVQEIEDGCELFNKVKASSLNPLNL